MSPSPPLIVNFGLDDHQFALIGKTIMNWSMFDVLAGQVLNRIYGITTREASSELVQVIDLKKKTDLLRKASKREPYKSNYGSIFREVLECYEKWAGDRNILAHGITIHESLDSLYIASSRQNFEKFDHDLNKMYIRSNYIIYVVNKLLFSIDGQSLGIFSNIVYRPE